MLVVEDEIIVRQSIAGYLRDGGWSVLEAASGDAAKAIFLSGAAIDIVFSDVQMPGAMDGIGLARWVHDNHAGTSVLLTSGVAVMSGIPEDVCPQNSIFRKPYACEAVAARMHALLT
ncbi:MAG: response regulator [Pseudomonadota bacterium]